MKNTNTQNALFIICPFCQLEIFLRTKFGDTVFFITAPAAVINFNEDEVYAIKGFFKREHITDIYLANDVSCNFLEEAISNKKEFGLRCEKELRMLVQNSNSIIESKDSLAAKKQLLAQNNVSKQLEHLNSEKIFKQEIEVLKIKIHGLISDKHNKNNLIIQNTK